MSFFFMGGGNKTTAPALTSSIQSAKINENGHLIFTFDSGSTQDAGAVLSAAQADALTNAVTSSQLSDEFQVASDGTISIQSVSVLKVVKENDTELILGG